MEHSEAIRIKAAEQYLLGELTGAQREEYEEHFFTCQECAREVLAGAAFFDNAREVVRDRTRRDAGALIASQPSPRWFEFFLRPAFALPALALLVLAVVYESAIVIPHLKTSLALATSPQVLHSVSLKAGNLRGGNPDVVRAVAGRPFSIFLDVPPNQPFLFYNCELLSESGSQELALRVSAKEAADSVQLLIPTGRLSPGNHTLVVRGGQSGDSSTPGPEVARYSFTLEFVN